MNVLDVYCHPLEESFHRALRDEVSAGLIEAGHVVDMVDLYAEKFDPVLGAEARRHYHDTSRNQRGLETYLARLRAADALVVQFPTWAFGAPAMLKGFLDQIIIPGVAFDISDPAHVRPLLGNIRKLAGVVTYGRPRWMALYVGDPPRKIVTRYLRWFIDRRARVQYLALYHMNVADDARRKAFMARVRRAMARF
jgi:putative NADPH-quinone reductase